MEISAIISDYATAIAVFFAAIQLWQSNHQNKTSFEESFNKEYRDLVKELPISAVIGEDLSDNEISQHLNVFYRYIDLTNEQIYLRSVNRISPKAWNNWEKGIRTNLAAPGFQKVWEKLSSQNPTRFNELTRLLKEPEPSDPTMWK